MSMESQLFAALSPLVDGRVYPDVAPDGAETPYITYQQVGGRAVNFIDATLPGKRNARVQVNVWGETRLAVSQLAGAVEDALRLTPALQTSVLAQPVAEVDEETRLRGSRQDFSFWN